MPPKKTTTVTDPLESAKILDKPAPETPPPAPAFNPPPNDAQVIAAAAAEAAKPPEGAAPPDAEGAPAEAATPPAPPKVVRYRVNRTVTISLMGQLTRLNKDDIVSVESYGPVAMQRIFENNVELIPLD